MRTGSPEAPEGVGGLLDRASPVALLLAAVAVGLSALGRAGLPIPGGLGVALLVAVGGIALCALGLASPPLAVLLLLVTMFFRLALPQVAVVDPFVLAYGGLLGAMAIWIYRTKGSGLVVGPVEVAMVLYVLWSIGSMLLPHEYRPVKYPLDGSEEELPRFILISTVIPFTMFVVGRAALQRTAAVRLALWSIVGFAAYSTWVSIGQFHAPALVWPRYVVDTPNWEGRANGVLNQPVGNGMVLVVGFAVAMVLAGSRGEPRWRRIVLWASAVTSCYAIYLTHTRAAYLGLFVVLVLGIVLGTGLRARFAAVLLAIVAITVANWSTFTSSDRSAGGVASENEIWDRLNLMATSWWAFREEPWFGWGIGRFVAVNTFHHQRWSQDIPWNRGLGIASHFNELGILVELGILGLVLWLCVLVPMGYLVIRSWRTASSGGDEPGLGGRPLALIALLAFTTQVIAGSSADLRLFDFPTAMVLLLVGMAVGRLPARPGRRTPGDRGRSSADASNDVRGVAHGASAARS